MKVEGYYGKGRAITQGVPATVTKLARRERGERREDGRGAREKGRKRCGGKGTFSTTVVTIVQMLKARVATIGRGLHDDTLLLAGTKDGHILRHCQLELKNLNHKMSARPILEPRINILNLHKQDRKGPSKRKAEKLNSRTNAK